MSASSIEWTEETWNPVTGCDRISHGCDHCYALTLAARLKRMGQARYQRDGDPRTSGPGFGLTLHEDKVNEPLRWRRPRVVFVNSMSDLFHKDVPVDFVAEVFEVMSATPQHTYQVLTKRPKRMARVVAEVYERWGGQSPPLPNVWLGTSIESRDYIRRADHLRDAPAAVRFISAEPLLGPLVPKIAGSFENPIAWWPDGDDTPCVRYDGLDRKGASAS
jgi:protein gp37